MCPDTKTLERNGDSTAMQPTIDRNLLECFMPGFYCDSCGTVYVDLGEILRAHGICDTQGARMELWSEIEREFSDVPVRELCDL